MHYPILSKISEKSTDFQMHVDNQTYPWVTIDFWDLSSHSLRKLEWGIRPSSNMQPETVENYDGTVGSICFYFDAISGCFVGLEIPVNLIKESIFISRDRFPSTTRQELYKTVFFDIKFWAMTSRSRPRERSISTPIHAFVTANEFGIEFGDGSCNWIHLAQDFWIAHDAKHQLTGIWCVSSAINFRELMRSY